MKKILALTFASLMSASAFAAESSLFTDFNDGAYWGTPAPASVDHSNDAPFTVHTVDVAGEIS